ncbi:MAG: carboxypeptidase regulatory-like domain-containing protein [Bryobacteraceae bacterium]
MSRLSIARTGLALCLLALAAMSQEFRATISGRVLDPTGGVVPNAKVTAVNTATNESSTATTDSTGTYSIPFLRPGTYKVTVQAEGFKQFNRENVVLEVGRIFPLDVTLEVGMVTESVNVTAEVAVLETQTASRAAVVTQRQVAEMPLNSRNPFMLGAMMSGVTFRGAAIWQRPFDNGAIAEWSVNGGRQSNNEFLMDGAPNNGQAGGNNIAYVPIVDAVQEFSVQQNSYDAQYGKTGGGIFNVVLKSGTNEFHATGWEFLRRKVLDANTYQNNAVGAPRPDHKLDQYGFQLEGPLYFPKLLRKDGNVRLFYLGSFENYRENWPQFLLNSYPEPEMRQGDFSKMVTADGKPIVIYNPYDYTMSGGDPVRRPFPGNIIPQSMISPVAAAVTKYMPLPNYKTPGVRYSTSNNVNPTYAAKDKFYNLILKFDWNFGQNHRAFVRHASNDRTEDRSVNNLDNKIGTDGQQPFQRINDAYVIDWVWTATPTTVLNVRGSYNRFIEKGFGRANEGFDLTSLGLPASLINQLPTPRYFGRWEFPGYSSLGRYQSINITNNYNLMSNLTKIWRGHTMKMGLDLRRIHFIQQNTGNILYFQGQTQWTQRLWNQGEATSGDSYASFLISGVTGSVNIPLYPFNRQWYAAPYFQDDWKVTRRLTLNLGLRWDYNGPPDEKWNRMNRGFNPSAPSPVAKQIPASMLALYPNLANLTGGLEFVGVGGNPRIAARRDLNNWQPRIGVAYQLASKLVMRGGYGLYYMNPNNDYLKFAGFSENTPMVNSEDGGRTLVSNTLLTNPYPGGIKFPAGAAGGYNTFLGRNTNWFNPDFWTPYVHQFSFGFQYLLTGNSTIDFSYVGSRTVGANDEKAFNIPPASFRKQCYLLEGGSPSYCNAQIPNPFQGIEAFRGTSFYTASTLSRYQLARPFPQFSGNMTMQGLNTSKIWYDSLQINYNHRVGRDLTLMWNYTLSKMIERWGYNDPFSDVPQRGLYFNDRPHYFKFNTVYDLPIGRGKKFGGGMGRLADAFVGGWTISTYTQLASGEPNNLPGNVIMLKDPRTIGGDWKGAVDWKLHQIVGWNPCVLRQFDDGSIRPQSFSIARGCSATDFSQYAWLVTSSYAPRYTPYRSGQIRKQRLFNVDLALSKTIRFTERLRAQIRGEAFNLTNYYFFGRDSHFNTNPNDPNFGTIFPHQAWIGNGYPRQVQIGFKAFW